MRWLCLLTGCASVLHDDPSLLDADREFHRQTAQRGVDAWVEGFAPEGKQLVRGGRVLEGHDAIRAFMTPAFARYALEWTPDEAESSGAVGWTLGRYQLKKDFVVIERGRYLTNWRKVNGRWYVTLDVGSPETQGTNSPSP